MVQTLLFSTPAQLRCATHPEPRDTAEEPPRVGPGGRPAGEGTGGFRTKEGAIGGCQCVPVQLPSRPRAANTYMYHGVDHGPSKPMPSVAAAVGGAHPNPKRSRLPVLAHSALHCHSGYT